MKIQAFTFSELSVEFDTFFKNYGVGKFIVCPIQEVNNLKPKEERVCRFCGLDYTQTTFENKPHIIPHLMGNKYLISDFECDRCNKLFGENYENDLAAFLGISRTLFGVKKKDDKIPDFESPGYKLKAKWMEVDGRKNAFKMEFPKSAKDIFNIDAKSDQTIIKYQKQPYTPIKVYKAILKIALSVLPEEFVADYKYAFDYLFESNESFSDVAKILHVELPFNHRVRNPVCFLYKKIEPENRIPNHIFALYFQNYIFELPIPFCKVDIDNGLYNGRPYAVPFCPPILLSKPDFGTKYLRVLRNFSSKEKVRETEALPFVFDSKLLNNIKAYNVKSGEESAKTLNADDVAYIYITPLNPKASVPKN